MKKEIHLHLVKRVFTICVLAVIFSVGGALYLELRQLDQTLLTYCQKESDFFESFFITVLENRDEKTFEELKSWVGRGVNRTSFIQMEILDEKKSSVVQVVAPEADAAMQKFADSGRTIILSDSPDGIRLISNKRIYFKTMLPIFDKQQNLRGYLNGLYLLSLDDTQKLVWRLLLTAGIAASAVLVCAFFCYVGFLLLNNRIIRTTGHLSRANIFLLKKLGTALAKSDTMDPAHNYRVCIYAIKLAEQTGLAREELRGLIHGSFLHDLEMLPIPSSILLKQDPLKEEEFEEIKKHPKAGYTAVKNYSWLRSGGQVIRFHHEKYDGSGYPAGVKHEKIPLVARIFTIADAFDALCSKRPYRDALDVDDALATLEQESGVQFDPVLLSSFVKIIPPIHQQIIMLEQSALEKEFDKILKRYISL